MSKVTKKDAHSYSKKIGEEVLYIRNLIKKMEIYTVKLLKLPNKRSGVLEAYLK